MLLTATQLVKLWNRPSSSRTLQPTGLTCTAVIKPAIPEISTEAIHPTKVVPSASLLRNLEVAAAGDVTMSAYPTTSTALPTNGPVIQETLNSTVHDGNGVQPRKSIPGPTVSSSDTLKVAPEAENKPETTSTEIITVTTSPSSMASTSLQPNRPIKQDTKMATKRVKSKIKLRIREGIKVPA